MGVSWLHRAVFLLVLVSVRAGESVTVSVRAGGVLCVSLLTLLPFTSLIDANFANQQH